MGKKIRNARVNAAYQVAKIALAEVADLACACAEEAVGVQSLSGRVTFATDKIQSIDQETLSRVEARCREIVATGAAVSFHHRMPRAEAEKKFGAAIYGSKVPPEKVDAVDVCEIEGIGGMVCSNVLPTSLTDVGRISLDSVEYDADKKKLSMLVHVGDGGEPTAAAATPAAQGKGKQKKANAATTTCNGRREPAPYTRVDDVTDELLRLVLDAFEKEVRADGDVERAREQARKQCAKQVRNAVLNVKNTAYAAGIRSMKNI